MRTLIEQYKMIIQRKDDLRQEGLGVGRIWVGGRRGFSLGWILVLRRCWWVGLSMVRKFLFLDRRDANSFSFFSKMPFYQMLCITAHYNEYVRITVPFILTFHTYESYRNISRNWFDKRQCMCWTLGGSSAVSIHGEHVAYHSVCGDISSIMTRESG